MEEEKVTLEENQIEENKQKNNKGIKLFLYIIIFVIAFVGIVLASNGIEFKSKDDNNYNQIEKDNENKEEDEEQPEQPTTPGEDEEPEEFPDHIDIDAALKNIKIEVTNEDKFKLINSSNVKGYMSDEFIGEMYKEQIRDQYKLLYTISFLHSKMNDASIDYYGDTASKKIKKETLLKYAKMLFNEVTIQENLNSNLHYAFNFNLTCHKEVCTYTSEVSGLTDPVSNGYESYIYDRGEQIIVDAFYVEYANAEFKDYDYNYIHADITLKDIYNGKELKTLKNYKLQISSEEGNFDETSIFFTLGAEIDEIPRYIFKFNDKNVLLSVEQG